MELFPISSNKHAPCVEVGLASGGEMVGLLKMPGSSLIVLALGLFFGLKAFSLTSAGAATAWPTVKQGSTGENVYRVQLLLEAHGYVLGIDGSFGPKTAATVKSL